MTRHAEQNPSRVRIGTSGWSYPDWVGPFHPPGTASSDFLGYYAGQFDIVEVDSTYYRPPSRAMVVNWAKRTPERFQFAVKAPSTITHEKVLVDCAKDWQDFTAALQPLGPKLHSVLLQFGYFNRKAFAGPAQFFERLGAFLARNDRGIRLAVEIRNKAWLVDDYFELLRTYGAATAVADHVWMPPPERLLTEVDVFTGDFVYLRLIGDRQGIEELTTTWSEVVVDRSERLTALADPIRRLGRRGEVVLFANNHFAGHAPATCRQLESLIASRR